MQVERTPSKQLEKSQMIPMVDLISRRMQHLDNQTEAAQRDGAIMNAMHEYCNSAVETSTQNIVPALHYSVVSSACTLPVRFLCFPPLKMGTISPAIAWARSGVWV